MDENRFTWIDFYMEFADKLLEYRDKRSELISKLRNIYNEIGLKFPKLDSLEEPADIDPFTVFGLFNKGITEANRRKIIAAFTREFSVEAHQPEDFTGIPVLNNLNAAYYAFTDDPRRGEDDIENLWRVFIASLALASKDNEPNRSSFADAFGIATKQYGVGWKLTMGLYWVRPLLFVNMDGRNRWYLGNNAGAGQIIAGVFPKENALPITDGFTYLHICNVVLSQLGTDACPYTTLPILSNASFMNRDMKTPINDALGDDAIEGIRYWLYAPGDSANMWDDFYDQGIMGLGWSALGDLSSYPTKEAMRLRLVELADNGTSRKNAARTVWQFVHDLKPGDVIFAKRGRTTIIGRGVVTGDYEYAESAGKYPNIRNVEWTHKGEWTSGEMFAMKTLTDVTDDVDFVAKTNALFQNVVNKTANEEFLVDYPVYRKENFLAEVYMSEPQYNALVGVLHTRKNVILQGAPGVGKTFAAKRLAYSMMGKKDADRVMMVQFHQSYSYEDFIEGYRPSANGFELAKGTFYTFCKRAADDSGNDYFFIIDEINRGNLSKIFGELFMLIEADKRGPQNKLQLLYSHELFYVPSNVYLIGMMNTADRSLAMLDYALRRRLAFFDLKPGFDSAGFMKYRQALSNSKFDDLIARVVRLNDDIVTDDTLGEGFVIGHSFFCGLDQDEAIDSKLSAIVEYELIPMLKEYWFDDQAKVHEWSDALRRAIK